jgi:hypothetical protein
MIRRHDITVLAIFSASGRAALGADFRSANRLGHTSICKEMGE